MIDQMGSSDQATFLDGSCDHEDVYIVESFPVFVMELIAGSAAVAVTKTAVAPLERVKILLQTRARGFHSIGVYQSLKKLVKNEGLRGLYKGNGVSIFRMLPYTMFRFMTYEQYRSWILNNWTSIGEGPPVDILSGSAAVGTAFLCTYPLDFARTKLAYQVVDRSDSFSHGNKRCIHSGRPAYKGTRDVFRTVYKEGGICALYRGVGPTLSGILPYSALKYFAYQRLKTQVPEEHQDSIALYLSCGAMAGLIGQTFTYPLDVVRRQMQVDILHQGGTRCKSTMHGLTTIIHNQGWRHLYAGLSINYLKVIPSAAVGFASYDLMRWWLHIPSQS